MKEYIEKFVLQAKSKSLATIGQDGINVVPISAIRCMNGDIWLFDYFMNRTRENIVFNPQIAIVCWTDMEGYQIKGVAQYLKSGIKYRNACDIVKELHPDRVLKGLIVIQPKNIFSVSPKDNSLENLL
ncbi:MAG: pyridoxamine 5'-phosphate oxidase family protein [Lutibacter sp.]|jgi:predicted pyridoxine 5'-phosphate oxidase superfamily flavin-nucleotide-binding protein|nr:pyridoxamine 5'-phosphate oxidase family protein [Lutibacter sp.]